MNIAEKMKRDWDQRAQHHARFWIATENYHTEEVFAQSGENTAQALLERCYRLAPTLMESLGHRLWNWPGPETPRQAFSNLSWDRCVRGHDCSEQSVA